MFVNYVNCGKQYVRVSDVDMVQIGPRSGCVIDS
jgi:hypothetical protein